MLNQTFMYQSEVVESRQKIARVQIRRLANIPIQPPPFRELPKTRWISDWSAGRRWSSAAADSGPGIHLPYMRYEQQQGAGLAAPKLVPMRRRAIASDTRRKPAGALSEAARQEIDFLLARIAAKDPRG
jgi:hypothetical protein